MSESDGSAERWRSVCESVAAQVSPVIGQGTSVSLMIGQGISVRFQVG